MTLISHYTNFLEAYNIKYDIIYVDKYDEKEITNANHQYAYIISSSRSDSKLKKIIKYFGFRRFAKNIIKQNKYDFIIVWNSFTASLFPLYLAIKKRKKYCINIRDYFYENNMLFYSLINLIIKNASFTTISSKGFLSFLPKHNYIMLHSLNSELLIDTYPRKELRNNVYPIRISFIGNIRFYERNFEIINQLGNDDRFILQYFGKGADIIEEYAADKKIYNVVCLNGFEPTETIKLLNKTDIINNLYGYGEVALDTAISIRLYYGAYLKIPILVFSETHMAEVAESIGIGIRIDHIDDKLGDYIYNKYYALDIGNMIKSSNAFIDSVKNENKLFNDKLTTEFRVKN